jgi:flagellar biosynthesis/type III secretory pathway protein FliH
MKKFWTYVAVLIAACLVGVIYVNEVTDAAYQDGYRAGRDTIDGEKRESYGEGYEYGHSIGYDKGYEDGYEEAKLINYKPVTLPNNYADGYEDGFIEGYWEGVQDALDGDH